MTIKTVCNFNKYGFCKYRETCHHLHLSETCDNKLCENSSCPKRHPRVCRYFKIFNRSKFGSFCFYKHETEDVITQNDPDEIKAKIASLEIKVLELEAVIREDNVKIKNLEERSDSLERKLETEMETTKSVLETVVKKVTDEILETIFRKQDAFEKKQAESFDLLNENISLMIKQSQLSYPEPKTHSRQNPRSQTYTQPSPQSSLQCDICGKSFGSGKALSNHSRKDHAP